MLPHLVTRSGPILQDIVKGLARDHDSIRAGSDFMDTEQSDLDPTAAHRGIS